MNVNDMNMNKSQPTSQTQLCKEVNASVDRWKAQTFAIPFM